MAKNKQELASRTIKALSKKRNTSRNRSERQPFQLADLYLSEASVSRTSILETAMPGLVNLVINIGAAKTADNPNVVIARVAARVDISSEPGADPAVKIQATFVLAYAFSPGVLPVTLDPQWVGNFGRTQAVIHAWPYWREFVQSATTRMGLPALRMPLLYSSDIGQIQFGIGPITASAK
jgi:hypothetical protein